MLYGRTSAGARVASGCPARPSGFFVSGWSKLKGGVLALLLAIALLGGTAAGALAQSTPVASPVATPNGNPAAIGAAVAWLQSQQDAGGGFPGMSGTPDPGTTVDAVLALVSSPGFDEAAVQNATAYLNDNAKPYIETGAGQAAKVVLAMAATGGDPTSVNGTNPVDLFENGINAGTGLCGSGVFDHAYCLLARVAIGKEVPQEWIEALRKVQISNGGWAFDGSADEASADSNTTALAIQALIAAGVPATDPAIVNALGYLKTTMAPTGGFAYSATPFSMSAATPADAAATPLVADANSTAVVIQALTAAGVDLTAPEWGDPVAALTGFQNASGAFRYMDSMPDDNLFATVQAMPALAGITFPIVAGA